LGSRSDTRDYRVCGSLMTAALMGGYIEVASPRGFARYITHIELPCD
jgi:hypothetical protein